MTTPWKCGPHDMEAGPAGLHWARSANIVKSAGNPAAIKAAPEHATRIFRARMLDPVQQDRFIAAGDQGADDYAGMSVEPLNGYTHPNLWIEGPNEISRHRTREMVPWWKACTAAFERRGYRMCGPCAATGDYDAEHVEMWREVGWGLWAVHAYMAREKGPTEWNAYRMRQFWREGDPDVALTECGFDLCNDGDANVNGGALPLGPGPYGWRYQFDGDVLAAGDMLIDFARGLDRRWEVGATLFTTSPGPGEEWREKGFDSDPFCDRFAGLYLPWTPPRRSTTPVTPPVVPGPIPPAPPPQPAKPPPTKPPPPGGTPMTDWYPLAVRRPIAHSYTTGRGGRVPLLIVDHIAEGDSSPFGWFDQDRGEAGSSAHFWVGHGGEVEQYRPLSDTCWANGPKCEPDLGNPVIAWLIGQGFIGMNSVSVAIEHAGFTGKPLTAKQIASTRALHRWLGAELTIALDRVHVIGHYQIDKCTRAGCPGPTHPWEEILMPDPIAPDVNALRDKTYTLAHQIRALKAAWLAAGYPQHAEAVDYGGGSIERIISIGKGER